MKENLIKTHWNIEEIKSKKDIDSFSNKVILLETVNGIKYVMKEKNSSKDVIEQEVLILHHIGENIPVAAPIKTRDNNFYVIKDNHIYILYPFLEGESFTDHYQGNAEEKAFLMGKVIGDLHYCLKDIDLPEVEDMNLINKVTVDSKNTIKNHKKHFNYDFIIHIMETFKKEISPVYNCLPKHIIHRDIHPGNILFKNNKLSGIVDFELVVKGVRIFDPCYCGTSILVGDFKKEENREKWINLFKNILQGYQQKNQLTLEEKISLIDVLYSIQIIFMAFSCNNNDFEAAKYNEKVLKWLYEKRDTIKKI